MENLIREDVSIQKDNFLQMLSRIEQQTDTATAIKAFKQLLNVNEDIQPDYYQELIIRLCRLLHKKELYGEELYYRFSIRYFFDSALKINTGLIRQSIIIDLYSKILIELKANSNRLNIIILCNDLIYYRPLVEVIKSTCEQQVNFYQNLDSLLQISNRFIENYDILLVCDGDRKKQPQSITFLKEFKKKFSHPLLTAVYCRNSDIARDYYLTNNKQIDFFLYTEKMIYALLHIALNHKNNAFNRVE